jgi:hypothetical protein
VANTLTAFNLPGNGQYFFQQFPLGTAEIASRIRCHYEDARVAIIEFFSKEEKKYDKIR